MCFAVYVVFDGCFNAVFGGLLFFWGGGASLLSMRFVCWMCYQYSSLFCLCFLIVHIVCCLFCRFWMRDLCVLVHMCWLVVVFCLCSCVRFFVGCSYFVYVFVLVWCCFMFMCCPLCFVCVVYLFN